MLDMKLLRENVTSIAEQLKNRGYSFDIEKFQALEKERKAIQVATEALQNERNLRSKAIGLAKGKGEPVEPLLTEVANLGSELKTKEEALEEIQSRLHTLLSEVPNVPHSSVPIGKDETQNVEIKQVGTPKTFDFPVKDHLELAKGQLDLEAATRIAGARFVVLRKGLAKMHRALAQFMLDTHTQLNGYEEVYVPYLANSAALFGTGQLPKMAEDLFAIKDSDYWLIPTSEVSVSNLVREQILEAGELPLKFVCYSPCFRKEAGSYGKDTRGMFRQHQFDKVELVQVVHPEKSYEALEAMVTHAESILQQLGLAYRIVALCTGDIGFQAAKTYDLEVWLPGQNQYREISSCSNTEAFQARRMQARFRNPHTQKPEYLHTLNGSGLAVGRTLIAIMENYQDKDGRIHVPAALLPYMGGISVIE